MFLVKQKILIRLTNILLLYTLFMGISIFTYGQKDETRKADAAIVLGASVWTDRPSPVFRERINHAVKLYKRGTVSRIIFTGGKAEGDVYSESFAARKYALDQGVKDIDILIEEQSRITEENMIYARQIVEQNGIDTILIVSDPLHMKRAMLMAEDQGLNAYPSPTQTSRYTSWRSQSRFLFREIIFFTLYRLEYSKRESSHSGNMGEHSQ